MLCPPLVFCPRIVNSGELNMLRGVLLSLLILSPATLAKDHEVEVMTKIVYATVGDRELLLDAYLPKEDGKYPAVLVIHGGAWRTGNRFQLAAYARSLAKMGMACFAIDYRLAPKHKWPAQIEDCRSAVKWIRQHAAEYRSDPARLGAIGYSAGGHLVSLLATTGEAPSRENGNVDTRLQAVAAGGAPTDFRVFPDGGEWARFLMGGNFKEVPEKFNSASPAAFVDKDDPPIFFYNGTSDRLVPLIWTVPFHQALKRAGVTTEMHKIEGASHIAAAMNRTALTQAYAFLAKHLGADAGQRTESDARAASDRTSDSKEDK